MTSSTSSSPLKPLSPQEWETFIDDYNYGPPRRDRWSAYFATAADNSLSVVDFFLSSLTRKDFTIPLKINLLTFLEHLPIFTTPASLSRLTDSLLSVIQSPFEPSTTTPSLKDQFLITATSIFITTISSLTDSPQEKIPHLESLIELLLSVINRPNHTFDRQTRAVACECLRELETAFPCLLSEITPHLYNLAQTERTHVCQSYLLLLSSTIHSIVTRKPKSNLPILSTSVPLIPFNVPRFLMNNESDNYSDREVASSNKELRRVISFLLEWPQNLTPFGVLEFMKFTIPVAVAMELQASLLKVQFSGLLYTYEPLLCHMYLSMCLEFMESFEWGQEVEILRRLILLSKESQHYLVFRLLALHWFLGFCRLLYDNNDDDDDVDSPSKVGKKKRESIVGMSSSFYPRVFDPLALKTLKLELLAYCGILINSNDSKRSQNGESMDTVVKLFEDGLVCVSAFKWLPPWSTETSVAFRTLHKFLIGSSSHTTDTKNDNSAKQTILESTIFRIIQRLLVDSASEFSGLVMVIVAFINRLLGCHRHNWLGESLLETFDQQLLPKLKTDYRMGLYFPLFERIAESDKVSPSGLLELLAKFMMVLVEKHGPDTGLKSWSQGSKVLGICRTMMIHHHSSRLFLGLTRLLAFNCLYFPDLEVRDNARIYLRMLICIPGKKLRDILNIGEQLPGISPSTHSNTFFDMHSSQVPHDIKRSRNISTYIHFERVVPLLVKQTWTLSLSTLGLNGRKPGYLEGIKDNETTSEPKDMDRGAGDEIISDAKIIHQPQEPLRVMDSKISEIVGVLRRHFSSIPDFRHMTGLKIQICCSLSFDSEPFSRIWGNNLSTSDLDGPEARPALYATVLGFSSSAPYGPIPSCHIPFLLGKPSKDDNASSQTNSLDIVPMGTNNVEGDDFNACVIIELEPREPVPGVVDVSIQANTDSGHIIKAQLHSVGVGIEDMFLKPVVPEDVMEDAIPHYYVDLFHALWEACGTASSTGRETFVLKGGKGIAAISGTRSVKLLEVPMSSFIQSVERCLAPFVVSVVGQPLVDIVKSRGIVRNAVWKDVNSDCPVDAVTSKTNSEKGPLYLKYIEDEDDKVSPEQTTKKNMGCFLILIFLPPRFHLLFQMEVCDGSTLVRIRTDHWPCLAYVDDYLEALFFG